MSSEEKTTWMQGIIAILGYPVYLAIVLPRLASTAITEVPYVDAMLWVIGGSVVAVIVVVIALGILSPSSIGKKDTRDREIYRHGEYVGQSLVIAGALGAMVLAWLEVDWFWIANAIFLAFFLSAILGFITKVVGYRSGLPRW
jgi:hypothetical protein